MRVAGLFAGIGGFEAGLAAASHSTILVCDNDPHAAAVLERRFPDAVRLWRHSEPQDPATVETEVVAAGFPCQNLSMAGDKSGFEGFQEFRR